MRSVSRERGLGNYGQLVTGVVELLDKARRSAARSVNTIITSTYWEVGRRIVEHEQNGKTKADYGESLLDKLSSDLSKKLGRGFSRRNVFLMRQFYVANIAKVQTPSAQLSEAEIPIVQTVSAQLSGPKKPPDFPLPWSHYVRLLSVENVVARAFYEREALAGGWSERQLDRQVASLYYERTKRSRSRKNSEVVAAKRPASVPVEIAEQEIRDPLILEFLNLKDEYSESDFEEALVVHLQHFLLELGNEFSFVARQRRLRVGRQWYRIDLLFYHRRLQCLVVIDLKIGEFTHADAGQMNLYLNYAREHWSNPNENPPIGLILCSEKDDAVAHYSLGNSANTVLTREYKVALPSEHKLAQELKKTRKTLQRRFPLPPAPRA
jgi:predicted nuclease of restriction endonuclease-like (RecB) superfamily